MMSSRKRLRQRAVTTYAAVTPHVCASPIVVVGFWATSGSSLQPFFVIARHTFVALREGNKLFAADDVVDVLERLVAGTAVHFVQDGVWWRFAVCQHHLARRGGAFGFLGLLRGGPVRTCEEGGGKSAAG